MLSVKNVERFISSLRISAKYKGSKKTLLPYNKIKIMKPEYLIIHHTATSRDTTTFEAVKKYHISKGWGNIGYHFFIEANGSLFGYPEARGQDQIGAHCIADGMNYKSLGICLTGNFETEVPTKEQVKTLTNLIVILQKAWDIPNENILSHNEVKGSKTLCPGKNLIPTIESLRNPAPDEQNELLKTIKELRRENGPLKVKNARLNEKLKKTREVIRVLKVALESKKSWADKLIEIIKKNENN